MKLHSRICLRTHPACTYVAHPRLGDGPTWRMSSRAIKGPVGKRLTTICPEHVSGCPPGNKSPLRLESLSLSLFSRATRSFLSSYDRRQSNGAACESRVKKLFFSLHLSPSLSLLARRSGLCFLHGTRLRSPAASCLPLLSLPTISFRSADPRIIVLRQLTVPRDPVRP